MPRYIAIAAMASNRVIGKDGALPWHLPEDLKFFRKTTTGHPILMGRKTWESLGRPLPNRRNLILSRTLPDQPGAEVLRGLDALEALALEGPIYIIGGAEIYQLLLPRTEEILLTVLTSAAEGVAASLAGAASSAGRIETSSCAPGTADGTTVAG